MPLDGAPVESRDARDLDVARRALMEQAAIAREQRLSAQLAAHELRGQLLLRVERLMPTVRGAPG